MATLALLRWQAADPKFADAEGGLERESHHLVQVQE